MGKHQIIERAALKGHSMEAELREVLEKTWLSSQSNPGDVARRIHARFQEIGGADDLQTPKREPLKDPLSFDE